MAFDVTAVEAAEGFAARVADRHGPVSALVNNAGNTVKKPLDAMTPADFQSVLDVHVSGAFALTRAFLPQIAAHGAGSVLFTASMASFLGIRSEEHTSELQSLMRNSYAVFCLKKKNKNNIY